MVGRDEAARGDADVVLDGCVWQLVASLRRAVAHVEAPAQREAGNVAPALLRGGPGEADRVADRPRRRAVGAEIVTVGGVPTVIVVDVVPCEPTGVGHPQAHGDRAARSRR